MDEWAKNEKRENKNANELQLNRPNGHTKKAEKSKNRAPDGRGWGMLGGSGSPI